MFYWRNPVRLSVIYSNETNVIVILPSNDVFSLYLHILNQLIITFSRFSAHYIHDYSFVVETASNNFLIKYGTEAMLIGKSRLGQKLAEG